ncbi:NAD-dependent epimerase/dehydratase family protein [Actinokineospora soli]|uniref:NAD-dependent epimerase/dehydratase family protein n=1 Tax=Actinokineospora soli TaxID=1048753 RepID=A0ABW2TQL0_9PSEU
MSRCLVLGARGYIGTLLAPALRAAGHSVRTMSRSQEPGPDAVRGDVSDPVALASAMSGVDVVYHLVHSMDRDDYAEVDARIAHGVATAAAAAGVRQLVYLGGPSPVDQPMSTHLASRTEVGEIFLAGPVPALVLRAAMVVGAGSASFELLAQAARTAPFVLKPAWMGNRSRPIAVRDVLFHLVRAASSSPVDAAVDVGGPEVVTYLELIQRCARIAGLPWRVPVPVVDVPLAAAAAFTDFPPSLVKALVESLKHDLVPESVLPLPGGGRRWTGRCGRRWGSRCRRRCRRCRRRGCTARCGGCACRRTGRRCGA